MLSQAVSNRTSTEFFKHYWNKAMNTMTYKGYTACIDFDDRDNILVGRLLGIHDVIAFHADNISV